MKPRKAILYARFSPRPNAQECESIEHQLTDMRAYCERKGWLVKGEFTDAAVSGADDERPGLTDAMAAIRRGYVLVVRSIDRLARDMRIAEMYRNQAIIRGGTIVSTDGVAAEMETPQQKFLRQIMQAMAEMQRSLTREHTSRRMLEHQASGRRMSRRLPYGYTDDPDDPSRMIEEPHEQWVVRRILDMRLKEGMNYNKIAKRLNAERVDNRGGPWWHTTVKAIVGRESKKLVAAAGL